MWEKYWIWKMNINLADDEEMLNDSINKSNLLFKAIIIDWGGVFTPQRENSKATRKLEKEFKITKGTLCKRIYNNEYWMKAQIGELSDYEFWKLTLQQFNIFSDKGIIEFKNKLFKDEKEKLKKDMVKLVKKLKNYYRIVLLTNADNLFRDLLVNMYRVDSLFDEIIISSEVGYAKPNPNIFFIACKSLDLKTEEYIFIDDSIKNVQSAENIGIKSIVYKNTSLLKKGLKKNGIIF